MQLKGKITISCVRGSEEYVAVSIKDTNAGRQIVEARLDFAEFGQLLTGLAHIDCDLRIFNLDKVGKKREFKTEKVEVPENRWSCDDDTLRSLLTPYEVDGWIGRLSDLKNHHCHINGTNQFSVSFERWVDDTESNDQTC